MVDRVFQFQKWRDGQGSLAHQEGLLRSIMHMHKTTAWGNHYHIDRMQSYDDFKQLPLVVYEDIEPYVMRMIHGESDVLIPGRVTTFSRSSGTTGHVSKYLPMPKSFIWENTFKAGRAMFMTYLNNNPSSRFFLGQSITIAGDVRYFPETQSLVGDVSALMVRATPWYVRWFRGSSVATETESHWETKLDHLAQKTFRKDIRFLTGTPTWMIHIIHKAQQYADKAGIALWPNLELIVHGAVAIDPYKPIIQELFPDQELFFINNYNASEGFFAYQDTLHDSSMLLATHHGIFYEFIELDTYFSDVQKVVTLADVVLGISYVMVITTTSGLVRYVIGDTVVFTNLHPFRIKVTGRTSFFINLAGEEIGAHHLTQALQDVASDLGVSVRAFTVIPRDAHKDVLPFHDWYIAFDRSVETDGVSACIDASLTRQNSDYAAKRKGILGAPRVHLVSRLFFESWLASRGKVGGQHKIPAVISDKDLVNHFDMFLTHEFLEPRED